MARIILLLACTAVTLATIAASSIVEHKFNVGKFPIQRLCQEYVQIAVNGSLPGPAIEVREGDSLVIHVCNESPYNITLHWHGVFQRLSGWADGPAYVTQCPIRPGNSYTYRFAITGQEGTLWWHAHAHISMLRATVHGASIIRPKFRGYPFKSPYMEIPLILGEWWNENLAVVENNILTLGGVPAGSLSDAYTINGQPGHLYPCSTDGMFKLNVVSGKTYLLRIVNAAVSYQLFFKIAQHTFTVVAIDASYTVPYVTDVIVIAPGQTADVLFEANQPHGDYYMAAQPYSDSPIVRFPNGTATGLVHYVGSTSSTGLMPVLPSPKDTSTAFKFYSSLTSLRTGPFWRPCPETVDEKMFITIGGGLLPCGPVANCSSPVGPRYQLSASMNNVSYLPPSTLSLLEAFYYGVDGIYTDDFPNNPPVVFDYTNPKESLNFDLLTTARGTRVKRLKYNSVVEIVFQNTALLSVDSHPVHLHGFDFYVLAQGFGNYDPIKGPTMFNLINPQKRSTLAVPMGVWFVHCHTDLHIPLGLDMAFLVENGKTKSSTLPSPPPDYPRC
ncbi:hypothetical protein IFM89_024817 [Coptis chinensis]|uniref:Laccase n=1 Tax=Coptis chinensis TaxID=261450 RepID=A0A835M6I6_9MAGN|nr:hypothetical protein IFM89_024817 [Coptis chinensis]